MWSALLSFRRTFLLAMPNWRTLSRQSHHPWRLFAHSAHNSVRFFVSLSWAVRVQQCDPRQFQSRFLVVVQGFSWLHKKDPRIRPTHAEFWVRDRDLLGKCVARDSSVDQKLKNSSKMMFRKTRRDSHLSDHKLCCVTCDDVR